MDLASLAGSTITGGVLGGLFSLGNAAVDFVNKRQEAKEAIDQLKVKNSHDIAVLQITHDRERQVAEETFAATQLQGQIDEIKSSFVALQASVADQTSLNQRADVWAVDIVTLFRPGLTLVLVSGAIFAGAWADKTTFNSLVELAAMAVAWWFGDRQRMKIVGR